MFRYVLSLLFTGLLIGCATSQSSLSEAEPPMDSATSRSVMGYQSQNSDKSVHQQIDVITTDIVGL